MKIKEALKIAILQHLTENEFENDMKKFDEALEKIINHASNSSIEVKNSDSEAVNNTASEEIA